MNTKVILQAIVLAVMCFIIAVATVAVLTVLDKTSHAIHEQIGEYQNLEDITTDPYQEANEGLQPEYLQGPTLPDILPLECGIERVVPPSTFVRTTHDGNGLAHHQYDVNGDTIVDTEILIPVGDSNKRPLYYAFDRDDIIRGYHGPFREEGLLPFVDRVDIVYGDGLRDGTCDKIYIQWVPVVKREPFDPQGEL